MSIITRREYNTLLRLIDQKVKLAQIPYAQGSNITRRTQTEDDILSDAILRRHINMLRPTASGMMVHVNSGLLYVPGDQSIAFDAANTSEFTAAVTNPRIDLVALDGSGLLVTVEGTEDPSPSAPTYPAGYTVLAEVTIGVSISGLYDTNIRDVRPFITQQHSTHTISTVIILGDSTASLTTGTDKNPLPVQSHAALTINKVRIKTKTAPTGQALIVDVNVNSSTVFTTQSNRPQIAAGSTEGETTTIDLPSLVDGDDITFDIDQIGSGDPGGSISVQVICDQDITVT